MTQLLGRVLPLALGAAVSPTIVAAAVLVLASRTRPVARGAMFTLGTVVVLAGYTLLGLTALSNVSAHPSATTRAVSGGIDTALGIALLAYALRELLLVHPATPDPRTETRAPTGEGVFAAFLLGAVMMLTNFTSLVLYIPAMKDIHRSVVSDGTKAAVVLVAFLVTALPALVPLGARVVAPGPSARGLTRVGTFMTVHKRGVTVAVAALFGGYLLVRGLGQL